MTVAVSNIIPAKQAEAVQTGQYSSAGAKTIVDKFTVTNTTATAADFAVNIITSGGAAGASNLILSRSIPANSTDTCPELVGQVLEAGDSISTLAGTAGALTIRASGRLVT